MTCEAHLTKMTDFLTGNLTDKQCLSLQNHYTTCPHCGPEFERISRTWEAVGTLPEVEPSPQLRKNFYTMLEGYVEGRDAGKPQKTIPMRQPRRDRNQLIWQLLAAAALVLLGFLFGRPFDRTREVLQPTQVDTASLAWIKAPSATTRLENIQEIATKNPQLPQHLISVMFFILQSDPTVDVRLAALRALQPYCQQTNVREGFVEALLQQDAPLVQMEIIELLCSTNQPETTDALEQLLQREPLNPFVKQRAQELLLESR